MIPKAVDTLFSRMVDVAEEVNAPLHLAVEADAMERAGLAARFGLVSVNALTASAVLQPLDEGIVLRVEWRAEVVQSCVVTLAPVEAHLEGDFDLIYMSEGGPSSIKGRRDLRLSLGDPDPPEPLIDGRIDVGEALAEHLGLALDPYPRVPGAEWAVEAEGDGGALDEPSETPFAVLASMRTKG
jgi:uncharacterized metal-binding protein YceD (DUF177 family)